MNEAIKKITAKQLETNWFPDRKLIVTKISGVIDLAAIREWERSILHVLNQLESYTSFKILVNMFGAVPCDAMALKQFNMVVPRILSQYGWKVGYIDLFEEEADAIRYVTLRGITCFGAAHCHHDSLKMEHCEIYHSSNNEHYFIDPRHAQQWIETLPPKPYIHHSLPENQSTQGQQISL